MTLEEAMAQLGRAMKEFVDSICKAIAKDFKAIVDAFKTPTRYQVKRRLEARRRANRRATNG